MTTLHHAKHGRLQDETGLTECTLFPKVYEQYCHLLATHGPLLLKGYLDEDFGARTFTVEHVCRLH
ncbi:MAG: hypothetical protein PHI97_33225 [Desulfobulbus sp.]|nr:hypothetical protein [Desulfobulbus sp.]